MRKKWFTLLEVILVISILGILIVAARQLFVSPNKNIIDSEVCMNALEGKINSYFFNIISWKNQYQQGNSIAVKETNIKKHTIFISTEWGGDASVFEVWLKVTNLSGVEQIVDYMRRGPGTLLPLQDMGCATKKYVVLLSISPIIVPPNSIIKISLTKNLQGDSSLLPMEMTREPILWWPLTPIPISFPISLGVCSRNPDGTLVLDECIITRKMRFEVATQSFKTNICLGIDRSTNICSNRTVTNR